MKNILLSASARTNIIVGIVLLLLRFLILQAAVSGIVPGLFGLVLWLIAWAAIIIGMVKIGNRDGWESDIRERAKDNPLLSAAVSASAMTYVIAGIVLHLLLFLIGIALPDNFLTAGFVFLGSSVAWAAIAIAIVMLGNRKGWWGGGSEPADLGGGADLAGPADVADTADLTGPADKVNSQSVRPSIGKIVIGVALILSGLVVRSTGFLEFLYSTGFLMETVISLDQGLWPLYQPLYSSMGTGLHEFSPTLGVLGWAGIVAGIVMLVIGFIKRSGQEEKAVGEDGGEAV